MKDIPGYYTFVKVDLIDKGWSEDKKYCVTDKDSTKYLLRISPLERYEHRKNLHKMMRQVSALGVPVCQPIDFGICSDGVYSLHSWIDGEDLEDILPLMSEAEQYVFGLQSGEILRKIHSVPAPENQEDWDVRFIRKTNYKIQEYRDCGIRFDGDEEIINYIEVNRHLLKNRPQSLQHGDYSVSNMMYANEKVYAIDLSVDYGDPWQDFESIRWSVDKSTHFATGMARGYFENNVPDKFWVLLKLYLAEGCFHNLVWSINTGVQSQIDTTLRQIDDVQQWFEYFEKLLPSWYLNDFYIQYTNGVPYKLKAPFDFSFLSKYGRVFKVFDNQGSGNICFGVADGERRYFIKFAGAPTENYIGTPENAIERLKRAVPAYRDLSHPNLINLIAVEEIGGGVAAVFDWVDAVHMWTPEFKDLQTEKRHEVFDAILSFHAHMTNKGYTLLDLYEDHILWDVKNEKAVICDIDFYSKGWYEGMSGIWNPDCDWYFPEQYIDGAVIDEISCVYAMGAASFALFADSDRSRKAWQLSETQYDVVKKAVSDDRSLRQQSIAQLIEEWEAAK